MWPPTDDETMAHAFIKQTKAQAPDIQRRTVLNYCRNSFLNIYGRATYQSFRCSPLALYELDTVILMDEAQSVCHKAWN
jgi:hypothetical protein